jgi:hypothetical protein
MPASFASEFAELCQQVIVWEPMTSRDVYGKPIYGAQQTFQGRRTFEISRIPLKHGGAGPRGQGVDVISDSVIWMLATPNIRYDDLVFVQGDQPPIPTVLSVERYPDETGLDVYSKISLGSANG